MGIEANLSHYDGDCFTITSDRQCLPTFEIHQSAWRDRWAEVHINAFVRSGFSRGVGANISFNTQKIRIHGGSVKDLMDAMIEDANLRRYLKSGLDYFEAREKEKADG